LTRKSEDALNKGKKSERSKSAVPVKKTTFIEPSLSLLLPQTVAKFSKSIDDLPLHVDYPRLYRKISVYDEDDNVIWQDLDSSGRQGDEVELMLELLLTMSDMLGLDGEGTTELFRNSIQGNHEISNGLKEFYLALGPSHGLIGILKCVNQDIIVPAVTVMKYGFFNAKLNYFEIRGKWNITIKFCSDKIVVTNRRWERTSPETHHFSWDLNITLNKDATKVTDTTLYVKDIVEMMEEISEGSQDRFKVAIGALIRNE